MQGYENPTDIQRMLTVTCHHFKLKVSASPLAVLFFC